MDFPDSLDKEKIARIISDVAPLESQLRISFLETRGVGEKYWKNSSALNASPNDFGEDLTAYLSKEYEENLDNPIWKGFIDRQLVLITFLKNLTESDSKFKFADDKDFIHNLFTKWKIWCKNKLEFYCENLCKLHGLNRSKNSRESQSKLKERLDEIQRDLKLENEEYEKILSRSKKYERDRILKRIVLWLLILPSTISCAVLNADVVLSPSKAPHDQEQKQQEQEQKQQEQEQKQQEQKLDQVQGWMFIGKITRNSSGDDILAPPTIYPRMIPQNGAIVEVIEITNIRSDQPQAPDFDYAQQEILGCVVPGEQVRILQVEFVPNQAVWARVQKYGDNPTFSPRCPSNGIRAWW